MSGPYGLSDMMADSTLMKAEAKRLLDVAFDAKISDGSSNYLKNLLQNVSIDFDGYDDSSSTSQHLDLALDEMSQSDRETIDSPELSLSDSQNNNANVAKRQLLMKILMHPLPAKSVAQPAVSQSYGQTYPSRKGNDSEIEIDDNDIYGETARTIQTRFTGGDNQQLNLEIERLSSMLVDRRMMFRDLTISNAMLHDLQLRPEAELTIHELACLRSAEHASSIKNDLESTRLALQVMSQSLAASASTIDDANADLLRLKRTTETALEGEKLEKRALEERCQRTVKMMESEAALRRQCEDKAARCDKATEEAARYQLENTTLHATLTQQGVALKALSTSEKAASTSAADSERAKELLQSDKLYLQQELRYAEAKGDEKERALEASVAKALCLEVKVGQLTDQLVLLQLSSRNEFDARMEREMGRLRDESQREMEALKLASRDLTDRENRVLREAKTSLDVECEQMRRSIASLSEAQRHMVREHSLSQNERNKEISELRADLKIKAFELTALGASFEERMSLLRQLELESALTKEEVVVHRSAFLQLESESTHQISNLKTALKDALSRLQAYEELEEGIDNAIMRSASPSSIGLLSAYSQIDGMSSERKEGGSGDIFQLVKGLPTNPDRRIRQCVQLAQRLLVTEEQRENAKKKSLALEAAAISMKKQLEAVTADLSRTAQPTAYLVARLRDEEDAKKATDSRCQSLEEVICVKNAALKAFETETGGLKERLSVLLQQRSELDNLKTLLEVWKRKEEEENNNDDVSVEGGGFDSEDDDDGEEENKEIEVDSRSGSRGKEDESDLRSSPRNISVTTPFADVDRPQVVNSNSNSDENPGIEVDSSYQSDIESKDSPLVSRTPTPESSVSTALKKLSPTLLLQMLTPPTTNPRATSKAESNIANTSTSNLSPQKMDILSPKSDEKKSSSTRWHTREIL